MTEPPVNNIPNTEPDGILFPEDKLDVLLIKKKGFLRAVNEEQAALNTTLANEETEIGRRYGHILAELIIQRDDRICVLDVKKEQFELLENELEGKRQEYIKEIGGLQDELKILLVQLEKLQLEIEQQLQKLGEKKAGIVGIALENLKAEIMQAMSVYRELQDEQNGELLKAYDRDKAIFQQKIDFWRGILADYEERYRSVNARLRILTTDGMDPGMARFLGYLGTGAVVAAGWWFSIWAGKAGSSAGNISGNTNVNFFIIDNIGRYLAGLGTWLMLLAVILYIGLVAGVSYGCHLLLLRFGYVSDQRAFSFEQQKREEERDEFRLQEEKLLRFRIRSSSWWGFWLKATPFLCGILPLLGVISNQVSRDGNQDRASNTTTFQGLMDSLTNDVMGGAIALVLAAFVVLFLLRVVEAKHHRQQADGNPPGTMMPFYYAGFVFFGLMALAMLLYNYHLPILDDIRRVAIFGFTVSCLAAATSLAYSYIFSGLKYNADQLLYYVDAITDFIRLLSAHIPVNYTTNQRLRTRIYLFQDKVFDLIEGRHDLANAVSATLNDEEKTAQEEAQQPAPPPVKTVFYKTAVDTFRKLSGRMVKWLLRRKKRGRSDHAPLLEESGINADDLRFFPEVSLVLGHLRERIAALEERESEIRSLLSAYNEYKGTIHSLTELRENQKDLRAALKDKEADIRKRYLQEAFHVEQLHQQEVTLFREGYTTGIWFRKFKWQQL